MEIQTKINKLKKDLNAVILAHNYQMPEIQEIADYRGDSLGLSIEAKKTTADVIVFCGVLFMAETAKIISPHKKVIIPDSEAGCPMAAMIKESQLVELKQKYPDAKVMCYVNSTAKIKSLSDVCCTSANAVKIAQIAFTENDEIIFVPDQHLARFTQSKVNRNFVIWKGYCPTHARILPENIDQTRKLYPKAEILVHPECTLEVIKKADFALSTAQMSRHVENSSSHEFAIGTEEGMIYRLSQDNPNKKFYKVSEIAVCPNMKKITLDKVLFALESGNTEIELENHIIEKARHSINKMFDFI